MRKPQPGRVATLHTAVLWLADMKTEKNVYTKSTAESGREEGGEKTLPLPLTVREWLQADARLLIKAAKAIAELNEM